MKWPHWRRGWSEKRFGAWFLQYSFFSQWSHRRHAITLLAVTVDFHRTPSVSEDAVLPSNRFVLLDLAFGGFCFHVSFCKDVPFLGG